MLCSILDCLEQVEGNNLICNIHREFFAQPAQVTHHCPACEAAARELAAINRALNDPRVDNVMSTSEAVAEMRQLVDDYKKLYEVAGETSQRYFREKTDLRARLAALADKWEAPRNRYTQAQDAYARGVEACADELRALLAEGGEK